MFIAAIYTFIFAIVDIYKNYFEDPVLNILFRDVFSCRDMQSTVKMR